MKFFWQTRLAGTSPALLALIELARVSRHFEATDEIGIAGRARRFGADAIAFFGRQERRPFVDEFLPHGLFALHTLRESKIRSALLGRI